MGRKFKVGDRVKLARLSKAWKTTLIVKFLGETGVVREVLDDADFPYLVAFYPNRVTKLCAARELDHCPKRGRAKK